MRSGLNNARFLRRNAVPVAAPAPARAGLARVERPVQRELREETQQVEEEMLGAETLRQDLRRRETTL